MFTIISSAHSSSESRERHPPSRTRNRTRTHHLEPQCPNTSVTLWREQTEAQACEASISGTSLNQTRQQSLFYPHRSLKYPIACCINDQNQRHINHRVNPGQLRVPRYPEGNPSPCHSKFMPARLVAMPVPPFPGSVAEMLPVPCSSSCVAFCGCRNLGNSERPCSASCPRWPHTGP